MSFAQVLDTAPATTCSGRSGNFHVKNNSREKLKFSWFRSIREIFLMVADYNMDARLESSHRLVYYRVSREPGIAGCSRQYGGEVDSRASLFIDRRRIGLTFAC